MKTGQPTSTPRGRSQRERVLRAAMDTFSTQGFRGASLDAVADAVGMTRQGLLHYFPSKVQLQHLLDPASVDMAEPLADLLALLDPVSPRAGR